MIKRPLDIRFEDRVREGRKCTTIRDKPWPIGKPIMLYRWSGKPYSSPQIDVCPVVVTYIHPITISNTPEGMRYSISFVSGTILWECEGFDSGEDMDSWFSSKIKPGQTVEKHLMRFNLKPTTTL